MYWDHNMMMSLLFTALLLIGVFCSLSANLYLYLYLWWSCFSISQGPKFDAWILWWCGRWVCLMSALDTNLLDWCLYTVLKGQYSHIFRSSLLVVYQRYCYTNYVCQLKRYFQVNKVIFCHKDSNISFSFVLNGSLTYIVLLNIRQRHQHGCCLCTNFIKTGHIDICSYLKG